MKNVLKKNKQLKGRDIDKVILHCSDSPDYSYLDYSFDSITAKTIDGWHKARGWRGIGYHFVIRRSGIIETGRMVDLIGAHCLGQNAHSIGVCYVGTRRPTKEQIRELKNLYVMIYKTKNIDYKSWFGHYEFNSYKTCPCFSMDIFRDLLSSHHKLMLK